MSSHKVRAAKQYAMAMASVRLTHCCVSDARSWQALGTTKPVHQLQSFWQGLCWVWWPTSRSSRTAYGWLERIPQGTNWTAPSRCVQISLNLTHCTLTAHCVCGAETLPGNKLSQNQPHSVRSTLSGLLQPCHCNLLINCCGRSGLATRR